MGPTITLGRQSLQNTGRKGFGGSIELYRTLFSYGGLRAYTGYERFRTSGTNNDQVNYIPIRAGYQHFFLKERFIVFSDMGIGFLFYPYYGSYNGFTFSAGGAYNFSVGGQKHIEVGAFYNYSRNTAPFYKYSYFGWFTFRIAYGIEFVQRK